MQSISFDNALTKNKNWNLLQSQTPVFISCFMQHLAKIRWYERVGELTNAFYYDFSDAELFGVGVETLNDEILSFDWCRVGAVDGQRVAGDDCVRVRVGRSTPHIRVRVDCGTGVHRRCQAAHSEIVHTRHCNKAKTHVSATHMDTTNLLTFHLLTPLSSTTAYRLIVCWQADVTVSALATNCNCKKANIDSVNTWQPTVKRLCLQSLSP